ncbi:MAG: DUF2523 family protein, partial [Methylobacter sp.]|nr:DUF2523 family protein [Methylobacter sp.]
NSINNLGQEIHDFFTIDLYILLTQFSSFFIQWLILGYWTLKVKLLFFAWDVAQQLIADLNISVYVNFAWSHLESRTLSMLTFFRVPEAVNILISAGITKYIMRFIGV